MSSEKIRKIKQQNIFAHLLIPSSLKSNQISNQKKIVGADAYRTPKTIETEDQMNNPNFVDQHQSLSRDRHNQHHHKQRRPNHGNNYGRFEKRPSQKLDIGNNEGLNIADKKDRKFENFIFQEAQKNEQRREAKQRQYRRQKPQRPYRNSQFPPKFQDRHFHEKRRNNNYRRQNRYNNQQGQKLNKRTKQQRKYNNFEKAQQINEGSQKIEQRSEVVEMINLEIQKGKVQMESHPKGQSLKIKPSEEQKQFQDLHQQNLQRIPDNRSSDSQSDENEIEEINPPQSSEESNVYPKWGNRRNYQSKQPRNKMSQAEWQANRQQKLQQQQQRLIQREQRRRLNEQRRAQRQQLRNSKLSQPEKFPQDQRGNQYKNNERGGKRQHRNGYNNPRPQKNQRKFGKGNFRNNDYAHDSDHIRNLQHRDRNFIKPFPTSSNKYSENKLYRETEEKQVIPELPSSKTDDSEESIPESLLCPISQVLMSEPILVTVCGHTFQGSIIREWVKKKPVCPLCNSAIVDLSKQLIKNFILYDVIAHFKK